MNNKEFYENVNLECSIKLEKELVRDLQSILEVCDSDDLRYMYYSITKEEIKGNKKSVIKKLYYKLIEENTIKTLLNNLIKQEYDVLHDLIKCNGIIQDNYVESNKIRYLMNYGIVYLFNYKNKLYMVIPDEVLKIIIALDSVSYEEKILKNDKICNLAYSMVNLYGAVPFDYFLYSLKKYYNFDDLDTLDLDCLFLVDRSTSITNINTKKNIYMVDSTYLDEEVDKSSIYRTISLIEDDLIDYYFKEIELSELLKYKDMYYYEKTESVSKFINYLETLKLPYYDIDLLVGSIICSFRKSYHEGILFLNDIFYDEKVTIGSNNIDDILFHVNNIINDISLWGNKGWTNKEIVLNKHIENQL